MDAFFGCIKSSEIFPGFLTINKVWQWIHDLFNIIFLHLDDKLQNTGIKKYGEKI